MNQIIYDIIGIGIGPFNLGLAALSNSIKDLKTLFFDAKAHFDWHPGMQIPDSKMQVSYLADLVTLADPTNPYTYLNYLKKSGRLIHFGISENLFITRTEFSRYCNWVAEQLNNLQFSAKVVQISREEELFKVSVKNSHSNSVQGYYAKRIVIGCGQQINIPSFAREHIGGNVIHSSDYMYYRKTFLDTKSITVIGSGQSGAEIFYDLLQSMETTKAELNWITSQDRFYAMEYSKMILEMTSPDYLKYFYSLSEDTKTQLLQQQRFLYKGINEELLLKIYDLLYSKLCENRLPKLKIMPSCRLKKITKTSYGGLNLHCTQIQQQKNFIIESKSLILASGYKVGTPDILKNTEIPLAKDAHGNLQIGLNYALNEDASLFVQNAELHTHGFVAPDLAMGPYRNSIILNTILGKKYYDTFQLGMFQDFGVPSITNP